MIVICKDNNYYPVSLEINKEYEVIREENECYVIIDSNEEEYYYPKSIFDIKAC